MSKSPKVYHEGYLYKRPRGRGKHPHISMEFQQRFCRLTSDSLKYYEREPGPGDPPKNIFEAYHFKIVEKIQRAEFRKEFCFQVGDQSEVMYFAAESDETRERWMQLFRQVAVDNGNTMLDQYHSGIFKKHWSCCNSSAKTSPGCQPATRATPPPQTTSIASTSNSCQMATGVTHYLPLPKHTPRGRGSSGENLQEEHYMASMESTSSGGTITASIGSITTLTEGHALTPTNSNDQNELCQDMQESLVSRSRSSTMTLDSGRGTVTTSDSGSTRSSTILSLEEYSSLPMESGTLARNDSMIDESSYCPIKTSSLSNETITALAFADTSTLVSGSVTSSIETWGLPGLTHKSSVKTAGHTSSLSVWDDYLAIGSNFVQIVNLNNERERIFIADDEPLQKPPMKLVAFGPQGHLVTVNCDNKIVKVWPSPSQTKKLITEPVWSSGDTLHSIEGCIYSLSVSHNKEQPWLAVGLEDCIQLMNWSEPANPHKLGLDYKVGEMLTAFSHSGQVIAAGCSKSFAVWKIKARNTPNIKTVAIDGSISGLCYSPDDAHLAVGMNTGDVAIYDSAKSDQITTLTRPENDTSPATAMAFCSTGDFFASGTKNGKIQLWKTNKNHGSSPILGNMTHDTQKHNDLLRPEFCTNLPLINRQECVIEESKEEYTMEFLDYKIAVPSNATKPGKKITFQTGVMSCGPTGPFEFPPNTKPMSSIVWICSNDMNYLQKPVKIILSHCLNCRSVIDLKHLRFMKAGDNDFVDDPNGERLWKFHIAEGEEKEDEPVFTCHDGTLTTRHCCFYCIAYKIRREDIDNTNYYLTQAVSYPNEAGGELEIRFILSYCLETCLRTINEQYGKTHKLSRKKVTFFNHTGPDPTITITFEKNTSEGWIVGYTLGEVIHVNDVHFWLDKDKRSLKKFALDVQEKIYPPNVVIFATGGVRNAILKVTVIGADRNMDTDILLKATPEQSRSHATLPSETPHYVIDTNEGDQTLSPQLQPTAFQHCYSQSHNQPLSSPAQSVESTGDNHFITPLPVFSRLNGSSSES